MKYDKLKKQLFIKEIAKWRIAAAQWLKINEWLSLISE
jgi:hypothetical protein